MFKCMGVSCKWIHIPFIFILFVATAVVRVAAAESPNKAALNAKAVCNEICKNNAEKCKKIAIGNGKSQNEANDSCKNTCSTQNGFALCIKNVQKSALYIQKMNVKCDVSWPQLLKQMDRRSSLITDLIPDLSAEFKDIREKQEIIDVLQAAISRYMKAISPVQKMTANNEIDYVFFRLFSDLENYPELRADVKLTGLKDDIARSGNLISMCGRYYNEDVQTFNQLVEKKTDIAIQFGFKKRPFYMPALKKIS